MESPLECDIFSFTNKKKPGKEKLKGYVRIYLDQNLILPHLIFLQGNEGFGGSAYFPSRGGGRVSSTPVKKGTQTSFQCLP